MRACSHIKPICFLPCVICRSANLVAPLPPAFLLHAFLVNSPGSPGRAVTQRKPFSTCHGCPWSSVEVTREPGPSVMLSAASHYTHATAGMRSLVLCGAHQNHEGRQRHQTAWGAEEGDMQGATVPSLVVRLVQAEQ